MSRSVCSVPRCSGLTTGASGNLLLKGREDLDALDRVDAEVGVEVHVEAEHVGRIAGLLGDDGKQGPATSVVGRRLGTWRGALFDESRYPR